MLDMIKTKLWKLLQEKAVSLAMLYDEEGRILWYRGRTIKGNTISKGEGFSKSYIEKTLLTKNPVETENVLVTLCGDVLSHSARMLHIKSLIILPIKNNLFLYIDSGVTESFSQTDCERFKIIGELLCEVIDNFKKNELNASGISGKSPAIENIRELVIKYSIEEEPILLLGETGIGKNHLAELIHRLSGRKGQLIVINTPAIPENLFESEIFGHKKGAFTGAIVDKKGLVEEAEKGTLFFDEISEVPIFFQAKLLRFIETQNFRKIGDTKEKKVDVRIITASNKILIDEIKNKKFREDLYFRLNVLPIRIPSLRERKDDIRELVKENERYLRGKKLVDEFWQEMLNYKWPGNVRELVHVLKRAGIEIDEPVIGKEIKNIIQQSHLISGANSDIVEKCQQQIQQGKCYWDVAWQAFLDRDLNRKQLQCLLYIFFMESRNNLKTMSLLLHIEKNDYPRFISSLHKYNIHPKDYIP